MRRRLDTGDVDLVQLGDVGQDGRQLGRKARLFLRSEVNAREVRDVVELEIVGLGHGSGYFLGWMDVVRASSSWTLSSAPFTSSSVSVRDGERNTSEKARPFFPSASPLPW